MKVSRLDPATGSYRRVYRWATSTWVGMSCLICAGVLVVFPWRC